MSRAPSPTRGAQARDASPSGFHGSFHSVHTPYYDDGYFKIHRSIDVSSRWTDVDGSMDRVIRKGGCALWSLYVNGMIWSGA